MEVIGMAIKLRDPFQALERLDVRHWQPMHELERLQGEMNQIFDRLAPSDERSVMDFSYVPSIEVEETDQEIILKLETPGMEAKDLDVEVADDTVTIRGERRTESKTEEKNVVRSEFQYGKFERMVRLPSPVQNAEAKAEYKDGLLRLVVPKAKAETKKSVKIDLG
jgi:HSP20 family protein